MKKRRYPTATMSMEAQFTSRELYGNFACALDPKGRIIRKPSFIFFRFELRPFMLQSMWDWNYGHKQLVADIHVMQAYFLRRLILDSINCTDCSLSSGNHCIVITDGLLYICITAFIGFTSNPFLWKALEKLRKKLYANVKTSCTRCKSNSLAEKLRNFLVTNILPRLMIFW